jgi:type I restriction enzyme S subunit
MSEWQTRTLGEISEMCLGKMLDEKKNKGKPQPYLANINVRWGEFDLSSLSEMRFEDSEQERYGLKFGDLVVCEGGEPGRCALWKNQVPGMKIQKALHRVRINSGYSNEFVYYRLLLAGKNGELAKHFIGSTIKHLTGIGLKQVEFSFPIFEEQQKIAAVLSALDAKIDCNNRINAELEAMAKTLYDYWFVQFDFPDANGKPYKSSGGKMVYNATLKREIPERWDDSSVLAVADLLGGGTPTKKKPEFWGGDIPFFTPTDADGTIFKFSTADSITDEGLKGSSTNLFSKQTVFITARGSVGKLVLAGVDMAMNQSCYALRAKPKVSYVFLFFLAKELIHHLRVKSSGSVFDSIVSNDIELTKLAIPKSDVIQKFSVVVEPVFEKIANNTKESQQLAQLRNWLLPLLMNGQITVA